MAYLPADLQTIIVEAAHESRVPSDLALSLAHTESRFNVRAVSPRGAVGLFQLMPVNYAGIDPYDPRQSARRGLSILRRLRDRHGSWDTALAAYNWGTGNITQGLPIPAPVRLYVAKVQARRAKYRGQRSPPVAAAWALPAVALGVLYLLRRAA